MSGIILLTQRIDYLAGQSEWRDSIDRRWLALIEQVGCTPVVISNIGTGVQELVNKLDVKGVILTGGNSLFNYGGNAEIRDITERSLLKLAITKKLPVLGVCRGMQLIQDQWQTKLVKVAGHVQQQQMVLINGSAEQVNSFHHWGSFEPTEEFVTFAKTEDNVIKGFKHKQLPIIGIMWHPERIVPFREQDIMLLKTLFNL